MFIVLLFSYHIQSEGFVNSPLYESYYAVSSDHATLKLQQSSSDIVGIEEPFRLSLLHVQVCSTLFWEVYCLN